MREVKSAPILNAQENYYITSPIYYVNDRPHIGHAYTTIVCDVITRIARLGGKNTYFMTGTDEHGQKIEQSAQKAGLSAQSFVDVNAALFHSLADELNASYTKFLRTSSATHKEKVLQVWNQLVASSDIYLGKYCGWYSVRDEAFYDESEISADFFAPNGSPVEWVEEECYFFALSKFEKRLLDFYQQNSDFVLPGYRFNEVISFVKSGLKDLAVSRSGITWGISVPGNKKHVIYVWLDALTSYLSGADIWPADVHVVGKDILRFHAVYWPAFLMALNIDLPKHILSHGWWLNEGQKISKSVGNVIDPKLLIDEFGLDYIRYFLLREITLGSDGNFARINLANRINSELCNKIGHLFQRVLAFIYKQFNGVISFDCVDGLYSEELLITASKLGQTFHKDIKKFELHNILDDIINLADQANKYIDDMAPWKLIKTDPKAAQRTLCILLEAMRYVAISLQPFIPDSASKMLEQIGIANNKRSLAALSQEYVIKQLHLLQAPTPIFNRIEHVS